ncbi:DNA cytosine methyltransferase [Dolosigranulum pigrum]|jgi:modification methylase bsp6I|nr:DNA cytosine methyltransferase [Dolosigranulum pigrum]
MSHSKYKIASLFAGVGGIELGFEQTGYFETIYANEFDEKASKTYSANYNVDVDVRDVRDVEPEDIPDADIITSGFPCTSFSIAGYRKGFEDERSGDLFFETLRIIKHKKPKVIFLENVKNLVGHDKGKTFRIICDALESQGYYVKYRVMNATEFGNIPQNRERIYIVGFRDKEQYYRFDFPNPIPLTKTIHDIIDIHTKVDDKYYYTEDSFKHYDKLEQEMTNPETVYQWRRKYVRENQSDVVPTLTANMGTGGHNVPLVIADHGFRKLTPKETFLFQGYPKSFELPDEVAMTHQYKQAGNSVVVPVIKRIAENIVDVLEQSNE